MSPGPLEMWVPRLGRSCVYMPPELRKWAHRSLGTHERWVPRLGRISNFKPPKCREWTHMSLGLPELWVLRLGISRVFRRPKRRKWAQRILGPHGMWVSRIGRIRVFRQPKCRNEHKGDYVPWTVGLTSRQEPRFQAAKTQKMSSKEPRSPWSEEFTNRQFSCAHTKLKFALSCRQNAENEHAPNCVPLKCGIHDSVEVAFSGLQNTEN